MTRSREGGLSGARLSFCTTAILLLTTLLAAPPCSVASDYGVVGLWDMPTSRMREDGDFTVAVAQQPTVDTYSLTYQALPRVEATFRYSIFNPGEYNEVRDDLRDRSFGIKAKLFEERRYRPAVSVGLRDIIGTGVWSGEYVVASKRVGRLDLTLGAGWGRFASRSAFANPLGRVDERFFEREGFRAGDQGQVLRGTFFQGENVGVFGGFRYPLPRWNLEVIAEYSSDSYDRERSLGHFDETSPINFGVKWTPAPGLEISASRQLGQDFALSLSATVGTRERPPRKPRPAFWSSGEARSVSGAPATLDLNRWYDRLLYDVERSGVLLLSADVTDEGRVVWLEIENVEYALPADAIERVLTLAEVHLPGRIHTVNVILQQDEIVAPTVSYRRQIGATVGSRPQAEDVISVLPARRMFDSPRHSTRFRIPNFSSSVSLASRFQIMDPEDPLRYQAYAEIATSADFGKGFYLRSSLAVDLYNDFGDIDRASNSDLPRVRSDVARYLQEGDTGIGSLFVEKRGMLTDEIAYRGYAGILEEMYSGVGGEVLWRPFGSRFAYGANVNWVQQREFDRGLGHRDFETVTAHASIYWASPVAGYDVAVHAGRYLARDVGATLEVRRTFDNGWMLGAFATLTDVPFDEFGEGSFDKGMFFRIPFNSLLPGNTRGSYSTRIRLLQRDGGQRLEDFGTTLWWESRDRRVDALLRTRDRMMPR